MNDASDISWKLPPLTKNDGSIDFSDQLPYCVIGMDNILISINQTNMCTPTGYNISQLQVPTGYIISKINDKNGDDLTVSCLASTVTKTMTIKSSG